MGGAAGTCVFKIMNKLQIEVDTVLRTSNTSSEAADLAFVQRGLAVAPGCISLALTRESLCSACGTQPL